MSDHPLFLELLAVRGLSKTHEREAFILPRYEAKHDPFLLPDMSLAVERLVVARKRQEPVAIYGDYDIDGLTATSVLIDAFDSFGFQTVSAFIPNRFVEGYGLTVDAIERIAGEGAKLVVTVDCGSLSHKEIERANELGMEVIVTDHHNVADVMPAAVATINPKRTDHSYPFIDLAGVGVAFKLVQALQTRLSGLEEGQEKWLLDLVALGTVCDVVTLVDENRANVYWGLKVLQKTRRPGLKALMAVAGIEPDKVNARSLGFGLGPRMNAAGRLDTAQLSLDLLTTQDPLKALDIAQQLDVMNKERRVEQDRIFKEAQVQAEAMLHNPVLVVSDPGWSHGIIGIVAAKLLEKYKKPSFVLQELGEVSKGSARSFGDFSAADGIRASQAHIIKGGGHKLAAGVTLATENIGSFRESLNSFYESLELSDQEHHLAPRAEVTQTSFQYIDEGLIAALELLEPFGSGNPEPIFCFEGVELLELKRMGAEGQHVKLRFRDQAGKQISFLAFNAPDHYFLEPGAQALVWCSVGVNEWRGRRTIEGRLLGLRRM